MSFLLYAVPFLYAVSFPGAAGVPFDLSKRYSLFTLPLHEAETPFRDLYTGCSECSGALEVSPVEIARGEVLDLDDL